MSVKKEKAIARVGLEVGAILTERPNLCGNIQVNFKDGEVANVNLNITTFKARPLLCVPAKNSIKRKEPGT